MIYLASLITALIGFFVGHFTRELKDTLLFLKQRLDSLKHAEDADKPVNSGVIEPMTRAEMVAQLEKDKIDLLNQ